MAWNKYPECRPAEEKNYLCCLIGGHVTYLTWTGYAFSGMVNERITHWQPIVLPQEEARALWRFWDATEAVWKSDINSDKKAIHAEYEAADAAMRRLRDGKA